MHARNHDVSRRKLLIGCALGALTPCVLNRIALAETPDLADFIRLSAELTGRSRLSVDAARTYLQALGLARGALNGTETKKKARTASRAELWLTGIPVRPSTPDA